MVSVSARRAEIGLRRAVGATRRHILVQFLTESLVIAVAGGLAGIALGWGLALAVDLASPWTLAFSPGAALLGFAVSALAGVLFCTYPALRAAALSPVAALNDPCGREFRGRREQTDGLLVRSRATPPDIETMTLTTLIIVVTALVSLAAWQRPALLDALIY